MGAGYQAAAGGRHGRGRSVRSGLKVRREVLGAEYVDASMAAADDFMALFQQMTTERCWSNT